MPKGEVTHDPIRKTTDWDGGPYARQYGEPLPLPFQNELDADKRPITPDPDLDHAFQHFLELDAQQTAQDRSTKWFMNALQNPSIPVNKFIPAYQEAKSRNLSIRQYYYEKEAKFKNSGEFFDYTSGIWVKENRPLKPKLNGYCVVEPGDDPKWKRKCIGCRITGTMIFGGLGMWCFVERMRYSNLHRMRRPLLFMGLSFSTLSLMRGFDLTFLDIRNAIDGWWNSDYYRP